MVSVLRVAGRGEGFVERRLTERTDAPRTVGISRAVSYGERCGAGHQEKENYKNFAESPIAAETYRTR